MKSLPLQMQQNLILAATLLGGILLTPPLPTNLLARLRDRANLAARIDTSVGSATSFVWRPKGAQKATVMRVPVSILSHTGFIANVPRAMQGEWNGNMITSRNEFESTRFEFRPDGHYSFAYCLRQKRSGHKIEAITVEEGTVSFLKEGTFVMHPEKGHFQGNLGGGFVNRPMESRELGPRTFHWEWRGTKGAPKLYLGPDAQSAYAFTEDEAA